MELRNRSTIYDRDAELHIFLNCSYQSINL